MDLSELSILVVVPARGGSKRIPKKNIIHIHGQPMIFWPLQELSMLFTPQQVLVSTDSYEIKSLVESTGLQVPFVRPKNLSDDFVGTLEVVEHALNWFEQHIEKVQYVITVYPTAVLLNAEDIKNALKLLLDDEKCASVMSSTSFPFPIQRAFYENENGYAEMFASENYVKRSQDLQPAFHDAGQFYVSRVEAIRCKRSLIDSNVRSYYLSRNNVIDIDTFEDLQIAKELLKLRYPTANDCNTFWNF